jgi:hypothetical protein
MTKQDLTADYGSIQHKFAVIEGRHAVTLTQEGQIEKVVTMMYGPDRANVPAVYTPLPPQWSKEASALCTESVAQNDFMRPLMSAAWASHTHFESSAIALLATQGQRPTALDLAALKHYVAYLYIKRTLGLTYYEAPEGHRDIRKTVGLRLFADAGENQHLDGSGHWAWVVFLGSEDNGSGAVSAGSTKAKGVVGESVPVNELMSAMHAVRSIMLMKYILEELSGATRDELDTVATTVEGSAAPIPMAVPDAVVECVKHTEKGHLGDAAMDITAKMLARGQQQKGPAVQAFGDNQGVVNNIAHVTHNSKGLRRVVRVVSHLRSLGTMGIIKFFQVPAEQQLADGLSKQYTSPVQNADRIEAIQGKHPLVTAYIAEVHRVHNKRAAGKRKIMQRLELEQRQEQDSSVLMDMEAEDVEGSSQSSHFAAHAARPVVTQEAAATAVRTMQHSVSFLQLARGFAEGVLASCGYAGMGGLGAKNNGITEPIMPPMPLPNSHNSKPGLGFTMGAASNTGPVQFVPSRATARTTHNARSAALLNADEESPGEVFLAERIRRALIKLTPAERLLFSQLRSSAFAEKLIEEVNEKEVAHEKATTGQSETEQVLPPHSASMVTPTSLPPSHRNSTSRHRKKLRRLLHKSSV